MSGTAIGKVQLGRSGLKVSKLCFGLAPLGDMPDTYGYQVGANRRARRCAPFSTAR